MLDAQLNDVIANSLRYGTALAEENCPVQIRAHRGNEKTLRRRERDPASKHKYYSHSRSCVLYQKASGLHAAEAVLTYQGICANISSTLPKFRTTSLFRYLRFKLIS